MIAVCARAAEAQVAWARTSFAERRLVLEDLLEAVLVNEGELARMSYLDTGKSHFDALMGEVAVTCEKIRYTLRYGEEALRPEARRVPLLFMLGGKWAQVEWTPLGVIGAIIPWNYPVHNFLSPVISALFSGNACVVKVPPPPPTGLLRPPRRRSGHAGRVVVWRSWCGGCW